MQRNVGGRDRIVHLLVRTLLLVGSQTWWRDRLLGKASLWLGTNRLVAAASGKSVAYAAVGLDTTDWPRERAPGVERPGTN